MIFTCVEPEAETINQSPNVSISSGPQGSIETTSCTFNWTGSDPDGSIVMYYYGLDANPPTQMQQNTSKSFTSLTEGSHTFYLQAEDNDGGKSQIVTWQFSVDINNPPTAPTLNQIENTDGDGVFSLTWGVSTDPDGSIQSYELQQDVTSSFSSFQSFITQINQYDFQILTAGTYYFRVRAKDDKDLFGSWSDIRSTSVLEEQVEINVSINVNSIDFGQLEIGQSTTESFLITNQATSESDLTGTIEQTSDPFIITSGSGSFSLTAGQTLEIVVQFSPSAENTYFADLIVNHSATNLTTPTTIALQGEGTEQPTDEPLISVSIAAIDFGSIELGSSTSQTFTISNENTATGLLSGFPGLVGSDNYSIISGNGEFNLTPGESITVEVQYAPTSAGQQNGRVNVNHNASNESSPVEVELTGVGTELDIIAVFSTTSFDFEDVEIGNYTTGSIEISNSSSSDAALTGSTTISGSGYSIISGGGGFNLTPGGSIIVEVQYAPTSAGSTTGSLTFTHNATNISSPTSVSLFGTGIDPVPVIEIIDLWISDNVGGSSLGNGNDVAEVGERIEIVVGIRNNGPGAVNNLASGIIIHDSDVSSVEVNQDEWGLVDLGEGATYQDQFFVISIVDIPAGDDIDFDVGFAFNYGSNQDEAIQWIEDLSFDVGGPLTYIREASHDSQVFAQNPDDNYGQNTGLMYGIWSDTSPMWVYIDFDTESRPGTYIQSAVLYLYSITYTSFNFHIASTRGDWSENSITWNNKPFGGFYSWHEFEFPSSTGWVSYDVTPETELLYSEGYHEGFQLFTQGVTTEQWGIFNSGETSNEPRLEITYSYIPLSSTHLETTQTTLTSNMIDLIKTE
jgi:hypothetical protein